MLAAIMSRSGALDDVTDLLDKGSFYSEAHQRIYEAAVALRADGETIDQVSIGARLRVGDRLKQVGGMSYLATVYASTPAVSDKALRTHAKGIREKYLLRQMLDALHRAAGEIYVGVDAPIDFLDAFAGKVQRIAEHRDDESMQSLAYWAGLGLREATAAKAAKGSGRAFRSTTLSWEVCTAATSSSWRDGPAWARALWPSEWASRWRGLASAWPPGRSRCVARTSPCASSAARPMCRSLGCAPGT